MSKITFLAFLRRQRGFSSRNFAPKSHWHEKTVFFQKKVQWYMKENNKNIQSSWKFNFRSEKKRQKFFFVSFSSNSLLWCLLQGGWSKEWKKFSTKLILYCQEKIKSFHHLMWNAKTLISLFIVVKYDESLTWYTKSTPPSH